MLHARQTQWPGGEGIRRRGWSMGEEGRGRLRTFYFNQRKGRGDGDGTWCGVT